MRVWVVLEQEEDDDEGSFVVDVFDNVDAALQCVKQCQELRHHEQHVVKSTCEPEDE